MRFPIGLKIDLNNPTGMCMRMVERVTHPIRALKLTGPVLLGAGYVWLLYMTLDWDTFEIVGGGMLFYLIPPAGKESVIPAMIALGIEPVFAALNIAIVDIVVGLFLALNFEVFIALIGRIPVVGKAIYLLERRGRVVLKRNPWMEEITFIGLILFVIVPFQGSGALMASIIGNIIGVDSKRVLLAVEIGAISGTLLVAFISSAVIEVIRRSVVLGLGLTGVIILIGVILYVWRRSRSR